MMAHHIVARVQGMVPELEQRHLRHDLELERQHGRRRFLRRPLRRRDEEL
jgi:hypothetical protein